MLIKDTLVRPLVTEKSSTGLGNEQTYAFEVAVDATKSDVRNAIESFYGVGVETVRTLVVRGKVKALRPALWKAKKLEESVRHPR